MDLVIKLYPDKLPRIGVKYLSEFPAKKAYQELLSNHPGAVFSLRIEAARDKAALILRSSVDNSTVVYRDLHYNKEQLRKLHAHISTESPLQFVHIYSKANTLLIARPYGQELFVRSEGYEIVQK